MAAGLSAEAMSPPTAFDPAANQFLYQSRFQARPFILENAGDDVRLSQPV